MNREGRYSWSIETATPPSWAAGLVRGALRPVAGAATVFEIDGATTTASISEQFTADAGTYEARYAASDHFKRLFSDALAHTSLSVPQAPTVLDLGSGSGANSVIPCIELFERPTIVATDLSADLLQMMAGYLPAESRVLAVVMDAMGDHVTHGGFDLVTGASILHHLTRPEDGIRAAFRALRPGGQAVFFEPFEGFGLLRLAYQRILAEATLRAEPLDAEVSKALAAIIRDIEVRTTPDTESELFAILDDKWLFSRESISAMAAEAGFSKTEFVAHSDRPMLFRRLGAIQITLATGQPDVFLPEWAFAILAEFDAALPATAKRALMLGGTIVLTK